MNTVMDSILWSDPSYGIADYAVGDYNSYWNDGAEYGGVYATPAAGANDLTTNLTAGLMYLPRIEMGSLLATAGSSGGQVGAEVVMMWGTTGTLWGDPGYDTITTDPLWPFPSEAVIDTDMASYSGPGAPGARGFTTGTSKDGTPQTLTKYIWEYLGNQIPAEVYGLHVVTASLPAATVGETYDANLTAGGGTPPYSWSSTGLLPSGLTLDGAAGTIAGTPTAVGTTSFTVVLTDAAMPAGTAMAPLEIVVLPVEADAGTEPDAGTSSGASGSRGSGGCGCRTSDPHGAPVDFGTICAMAGLALLRRRRKAQAGLD